MRPHSATASTRKIEQRPGSGESTHPALSPENQSIGVGLLQKIVGITRATGPLCYASPRKSARADRVGRDDRLLVNIELDVPRVQPTANSSIHQTMGRQRAAAAKPQPQTIRPADGLVAFPVDRRIQTSHYPFHDAHLLLRTIAISPSPNTHRPSRLGVHPVPTGKTRGYESDPPTFSRSSSVPLRNVRSSSTARHCNALSSAKIYRTATFQMPQSVMSG